MESRYHANGLLRQSYGSGAYPVGYGYDAQGRLTTMTNWTTFDPNGVGVGQRVTTWSYHGTRGWLGTKTDANGRSVSYIHTSGGRLQTRTWARGVTTSYVYNSVGDLWTVTYSDGLTPQLAYLYDRRGRVNQVTQGQAPNAVITDIERHDTGEPQTETITGGPLGGLKVETQLDSQLRRDRLWLKQGGNTLATTEYNYQPTSSRLASVTDGRGGYSATYTYLANSRLVSQIAFKQSTTTRMTTVRQYDYVDRLQQISTTPAGTGQSPLTWGYGYNGASRRTRVDLADGSYWVLSYDDLAQLISARL